MATVEMQVEKMVADAHDEYRSMIFAMISEGEEFDNERVRQVALAAGFSLDDLTKHVRTAKNRYMWAVKDPQTLIAELSSEASTHQTRARELLAEMARRKREYEEAVSLLEPEYHEASEQFKSARGRANELITAGKLGLRQSLPGGWSVELDRLAKKHQAIVEALPLLQHRRGKVEVKVKNLKSLEYRIDNATSPQTVVAAKRDLAEARAAKTEYDNLGARIANIQADAQAAQAALDSHSQTQFDFRCCEFLTEAQTLARQQDLRGARQRAFAATPAATPAGTPIS